MKKIIITGGNGFIGSFLVKKFLKEKYIVLNIDKLSPVSQKIIIKNKNYKFIQCNLINYKKLVQIFHKFNPDIVLNCAAESHVDRSIKAPNFFIMNNIESLINILEIIRKKPIKKFIQISTDEVFGSLKLNKKKFNQNSHYNPNNPYACSKASCDLIVKSYAETYNLNYIITNCTNNYGKYQYPEKFIPVIIKGCIERKPIPVYGNGYNIRDWIHVNDHVEAIFKLTKKNTKNGFYLIGSNCEINNINLAYKICGLYDKLYKTKNSKKLIKMTTDRKNHDFRYAIDNSHIKKHINWKPKIKLKTGLIETIKFYKQNYTKLKKIFPYS